MNLLFPIIRRKRQPLIVAESPPAVVGTIEPVMAIASAPAQPAASDVPPKPDDASTTPKLDS